MKKYDLIITEEQANLILRALDFSSRLEMGQLSELSSIFSTPFKNRVNIENREIIENKVKELKSLIFPDLDSFGSFYGIHNKKEVPDSARISYDLIQVIRHSISWENNPEGGIQVCFDTPRQISEVPLASISVNKKFNILLSSQILLANTIEDIDKLFEEANIKEYKDRVIWLHKNFEIEVIFNSDSDSNSNDRENYYALINTLS